MMFWLTSLYLTSVLKENSKKYMDANAFYKFGSMPVYNGEITVMVFYSMEVSNPQTDIIGNFIISSW
jgi:hypothetical protein